MDTSSPPRMIYSIPQIFKLRDELVKCLRIGYLGRTLTPADFASVTELLYQVVPAGQATRRAFLDSVRAMEGVVLAADRIQEFAHRLAGNLPRLRRGLPVPPWTQQIADEWVPLQIVSVVPFVHAKRGKGHVVSLKILAGSPATRVVKQFWQPGRARFLAKNMGFTLAVRKKHPFTSCEQLLTFRFWGLVSAERSEIDPVIVRFDFSGTFNRWNSEQIAYRRRADAKHACPKRYAPTVSCLRCPSGLSTCRAATHRQDWVRRDCGGCGKESWFDPERSESKCLVCLSLRKVTT